MGIDPSDTSADLSRTKPVVAGMMQWYNPVRFFPNSSPLSERPRHLASIWLKSHIAKGDAEAFGKSKEANFDLQVFGADELVRWLSANGMKSVYQFERSVTRAHGVAYESAAPESGAESAPIRWPWGNHHTELLGHLDAAARRYWGANYDPSDPTTAPTNSTVSEWLRTDRKVSKTMAESIASMLRPDGLPTGPRKFL